MKLPVTQEGRLSILGAVAGVIVGLLVGGIGIVAMGGGSGLPAWLTPVVLGFLGWLIGGRVGLWRDRRR